MDITQIIFLLTPVIVWLVTWLVKYVSGSIPGWVVVGLIVPALSIIVTLLANYVFTFAGNFWLQVVYGLLAVFVNELLKQLKTK